MGSVVLFELDYISRLESGKHVNEKLGRAVEQYYKTLSYLDPACAEIFLKSKDLVKEQVMDQPELFTKLVTRVFPGSQAVRDCLLGSVSVDTGKPQLDQMLGIAQCIHKDLE